MYLQEKVRDINSRLKLLTGIPNIVIWGAGMHTCKLLEHTEIHDYNVKNIVDTDEKKHGNFYFGFTVQNPEEISWSDVGAVVISVSGKETQIMDVLTNHFGFAGKIITLYGKDEIIPFYLLYDEKISVVRYDGDYHNWDDACKDCKGYGDRNILEKVAGSIKKVLSGDAEWERDSCLFYEQKFVHRICAAILRCAVQNGNLGVTVLDVGGSLGSSYFQNRKYLKDVHNLQYVIAEQESFADYGHKNLEDGALKFIHSYDDYGQMGKVDIVLFSASLQYICSYKEIISKIIKVRPRYIILDRILVGRRRICRQTVSEEIYDSSYPVMIFSEEEICGLFGSDYELVEKDSSSVSEEARFEDDRAVSRYYVFERGQNGCT